MQFKVPQFLDIEDKIFGPFTFRQFIYLAGSLGLAFVFYRILGFFWGFIPIALTVGLGAALAFYRPNSKPFILMLESAFKYFFQHKLYIWEKRLVPKERKPKVMEPAVQNLQFEGGRLTGEKLRDLSWSLDVLDMKKNNEKDSSR